MEGGMGTIDSVKCMAKDVVAEKRVHLNAVRECVS